MAVIGSNIGRIFIYLGVFINRYNIYWSGRLDFKYGIITIRFYCRAVFFYYGTFGR